MDTPNDAWNVVSERIAELGPLPPTDGTLPEVISGLWQMCSAAGLSIEFGTLLAIQPLGLSVGSTETAITVTSTGNRPWIEVLGFEFISLTIDSLVIEATQITVNFDGLPPIAIPVSQ